LLAWRLSEGMVWDEPGLLHALIIEDQFLIAASIEDALRDLGFATFDLVATEDEAIAAAAAQRPALITSDVELAAGNGIDAVESICSKGCAIPVVYITGSAQEVRQRCATSVVVSKPFGREALGTAIDAARAAMQASS